MKSRAMTYTLLVAVLTIWGFVAWRILAPKPVPKVALRVNSARHESTAKLDTLRLDYPDPFLRMPILLPAEEPLIVQKPAPQVPPPQFRYTGTITANGKTAHIFELSGLLHTLSLGDELNGYTFVRAFTDSVRMTKNGAIFTLRK